jgi:hypothetical protein
MTVDMFRLRNPKIQYAGTLTNYLHEFVTHCYTPQQLLFTPFLILATDTILDNIHTQTDKEVNRTDRKK